MGDTSPKNIHKLEEQREEEKIVEVQHKAENAEAQHHAHPTVVESTAPADKE